MSTRWICQNEDGTYAVGEGDQEIATCKNRKDALLLSGKLLPAVWIISHENINEPQLETIQTLFDRAKQAHMIDIKLRIDGHDEWYEADWVKHISPAGIEQMEAKLKEKNT